MTMIAVSTPLDLIKSAFRKLQVLGSGESPTADMTTDALTSLNQLIATISNSNFILPAATEDIIQTTRSDGIYTIGPGGDINTARPLRLHDACYAVYGNNVSVPLTLLTSQQYSDIGIKNISMAFPNSVWYDAQVPLGRLLFYPIPTNCVIHLWSFKQLAPFTSLEQEVILAPGYEEVLIGSLVERLAPEWNREVPSAVAKTTREAFDLVRSTNSNPTPVLSLNGTPGSGFGGGTGGVLTAAWLPGEPMPTPPIVSDQPQWLIFLDTPTFISGNSFSLYGDQTFTFQINRRVQAKVASGYVYGTIVGSMLVSGNMTQVILTMDTGQALDTSMSLIFYGIISSDHTSAPNLWATKADLSLYAPINNAVFTGTTKAQTPEADSVDRSQVATLKYLDNNIPRIPELYLGTVPITVVSDVDEPYCIIDCTPVNVEAVFDGLMVTLRIGQQTILFPEGYDVFVSVDGVGKYALVSATSQMYLKSDDIKYLTDLGSVSTITFVERLSTFTAYISGITYLDNFSPKIRGVPTCPTPDGTDMSALANVYYVLHNQPPVGSSKILVCSFIDYSNQLDQLLIRLLCEGPLPPNISGYMVTIKGGIPIYSGASYPATRITISDSDDNITGIDCNDNFGNAVPSTSFNDQYLNRAFGGIMATAGDMNLIAIGNGVPLSLVGNIMICTFVSYSTNNPSYLTINLSYFGISPTEAMIAGKILTIKADLPDYAISSTVYAATMVEITDSTGSVRAYICYNSMGSNVPSSAFVSAVNNKNFTAAFSQEGAFVNLHLLSVGNGAAPINNAVFTGTTNVPTPTLPADTQAVNTAYLTTRLGLYAPLASPIFTGYATGTTPPLTDSSTKFATTNFVKNNITSITMPALPGYISGFAMTVNTSSNISTLTVRAGNATCGSAYVTIGTSIVKGIGQWSAGSNGGGCLDASGVSFGTWYYVYVIQNPTTQAVDIGFSAFAIAVALPSGYSNRRYIGMIYTLTSTESPGVIVLAQTSSYGNQFFHPAPIAATSSVSPFPGGMRCDLTKRYWKIYAIPPGYNNGNNYGNGTNSIRMFGSVSLSPDSTMNYNTPVYIANTFQAASLSTASSFGYGDFFFLNGSGVGTRQASYYEVSVNDLQQIVTYAPGTPSGSYTGTIFCHMTVKGWFDDRGQNKDSVYGLEGEVDESVPSKFDYGVVEVTNDIEM